MNKTDKILKLRTKNFVRDYIKITAGAFLMGIALSVFLVPFRIAPGGISGLSTVIHYMIGIKVSYLILIINIPIFIIGILKLKKGFLVKSLYGTMMLSFAAEAAAFLNPPTSDALISSIFGGGIMGLGIATVLSTGGTTGGTDVLVMVLRKAFPNLSVGRLYLIIDGAVIAVSGITSLRWDTVFYSLTALLVSTYVTDTMIEGFNSVRLVYIISDMNRQICDEIYQSLNRGVTALESKSMYSGKERKTLMCVIRKRQLIELKKIIRDTDPNAFVVVCDAKEVTGNGFTDKL